MTKDAKTPITLTQEQEESQASNDGIVAAGTIHPAAVVKEGAEHDVDIESRHRFAEIVSILGKNDIFKGISPEKVRCILEDLGPTYVKIGQIMSMRPDMIPKEYCTELTKLRAQVAPMTREEVEHALHETYGKRVDSIFKSFDYEPLGSASIAQAHKAVLKNGTTVVLKIQRPGIYDMMSQDIVMLRHVTKIFNFATGGDSPIDLRGLIDEMWEVAQEEMDFLVEAKHAEQFADLNKDEERISCPKIYEEYTTSKILVMEYIEGISVGDIDKLDAKGWDRNDLGRLLTQNYIKQIVDDGYFHADPHPGNIWVRDDAIVWIDMGMMGHLSTKDRTLMNRAIYGVVSGDVNEIKEVVLSLGVYKGQIDHPRLYGDIDSFLTKYGGADMGELDLGSIVEELLDVAKGNGISMPANISMYARGVATIEGTIAVLAPDIHIMDILAKRMQQTMMKEFDPLKKTIDIGRKIYTSSSKAVEIPALTTDLMKMIMRGQIKVNMELASANELTKIVHDSVDKIVAGLIIGCFLIGSSFLCTTGMEPKILGVPALGAIGFIVAVVLAIILWWDMRKNR